jgi:hypothetical protein
VLKDKSKFFFHNTARFPWHALVLHATAKVLAVSGMLPAYRQTREKPFGEGEMRVIEDRANAAFEQAESVLMSAKQLEPHLAARLGTCATESAVGNQ